jgi:hypothetical protein
MCSTAGHGKHRTKLNPQQAAQNQTEVEEKNYLTTFEN